MVLLLVGIMRLNPKADMASDTTIFVVNDDEAVRDSLHALLESAGFTVEVYGSGTEFLKAYKPTRRGCLLLDLRMPGLNGLELQERLLADRVNLPVIVIAARADVSLAVNTMKAGAVDFIEMPFEEDAILDSIHRALEFGAHRTLELGAQVGREGPSANDVKAAIVRLTSRECEVLKEMVSGRSTKEIAFELGISPKTVEVHRSRVMQKMQARSFPHLLRMALAVGMEVGWS